MSLRAFFLTSVGAFALALGTTGCATSYAMAPDAQVPFAKGEVDAEFTESGNGQMSVRVEHLGDPAKLNPRAKAYVVWVRPVGKEDAKAQNMGVLDMREDYSGRLDFTTPYRTFDISVTPEETADVTQPAGRDVLKTTVTAD